MKFEPSLAARVLFVCGLVTWGGIYLHLFPGDDSRSPEAVTLERQGDAFFREGRKEEALESWRRSLVLLPDRRDPYNKISSYLMVSGRLDEAEETLRRGVHHLPRDADLRFNLAMTLFIAEKFESAEKNFLKVAELDSYYPEVHYLLGLVYRARGEEERARESFVRELNLNPGSRGAWKEIKEMGA